MPREIKTEVDVEAAAPPPPPTRAQNPISALLAAISRLVDHVYASPTCTTREWIENRKNLFPIFHTRFGIPSDLGLWLVLILDVIPFTRARCVHVYWNRGQNLLTCTLEPRNLCRIQ